MRALVLALPLAAVLAGCGYVPSPPEPIRTVDSPADVGGCRFLGHAGGPVRTDGLPPFVLNSRTAPAYALGPARPYGTYPAEDFAMRVDAMRNVALRMGATDLLLVRRHLRDWSYVEGRAYRCRL